MPERLQKVLARAGIASRRKCESMMLAGRVSVNGEPVLVLGTKVEPQSDAITVDGRIVRGTARLTYLALNKPAGYMTTARDTHGRPTVMDLVPAGVGIFPVGRLDLRSEGLLLMTNDGALAHRLTHPRFAVEKEYLALVSGAVTPGKLGLLRRGVALEDGVTAEAKVDVLSVDRGATWLRVVIREGRKRQVRRMIEATGCKVLRLVRVRVGPVRLGDLGAGESRRLTRQELEHLHSVVG